MLLSEGLELSQSVDLAGFGTQERQTRFDKLPELAFAITNEANQVGIVTLFLQKVLKGKALQNLTIVGIPIPKGQNAYLVAELVHIASLNRLRQSSELLLALPPIPY